MDTIVLLYTYTHEQLEAVMSDTRRTTQEQTSTTSATGRARARIERVRQTLEMVAAIVAALVAIAGSLKAIADVLPRTPSEQQPELTVVNDGQQPAA